MKTIYINGRFLTQRTTGVQRFGEQIVLALDRLLSEDAPSSLEWVLLTPRSHRQLALSRIRVREIGPFSGHGWDQVTLAWRARDGVLINLCNSGPVLHRASFTVLHDAAVFVTPENFSSSYAIAHRALDRLLAVTSRIGTVSKFSQEELARVLGVMPCPVIPNGHDHLQELGDGDETILGRLGLERGRFFLSIGSPAPNKNLQTALAAYGSLGIPGYKFVAVGIADASVFKGGPGQDIEGVVTPGFLSDAENVALLRNAAALVFPSRYEGFGIPPLEAMACDCPVLSARIPPVLEVCGDGAVYFDPDSVPQLVEAMQSIIMQEGLRTALIAKGRDRLARFSWRSSATMLENFIQRTFVNPPPSVE